MHKMLILVLSLRTLAFLGCSENNVVKDEVKKELSKSGENTLLFLTRVFRIIKNESIIYE